MTEEWFHQFESRLEQLERLVHKRSLPVSELLTAAADAVSSLAVSQDLQLWLVRPGMLERVTQHGSTQIAPSQRPDILQAVDAGSAFHNIQNTVRAQPAGSDGEVVSAEGAAGQQHKRRLCVASPLAEHLSCVLCVQVEQLFVPEPGLVQAVRAIADVTASWFSHHLLTQSEQRLRAQAELLEFSMRLQASEGPTQAADIVAQAAPAVLGQCRASVWKPVASGYQLLAVTGVRQPEAASETVRSLQILASVKSDTAVESPVAEDTCTAHQHWKSVLTTDRVAASELSNAIASLRRSGTTAYRILNLSGVASAVTKTRDQKLADDADADAREPVLILELFDDSAPPDENLVRQWRSIAEPVLTRYLQPPRSALARWFTNGRRRMAVVIACLVVLAVVPIGFEVEVPGRIMAANQRNIFAPDNGRIDEVLFQNERPVVEGQILVKMTNPDLQLEVQRIQGEVDTTVARLATARAGRLTTQDPRFSSDEQQLEVQLESLKQQLRLVQQQAAELHIAAPVSGMAFRRDPERSLLARPVQRGQRLLEIVPDSAQWELQLDIPARLLGYVTNAHLEQREHHAAPVRYLIRSAPQRDWTTQLATIQQAVQSENGQLVCRATAAVQELPDTDLRPGTSVTARIYCGRRALGFVLFREILDFWRQIKFAWF